MEEGVDLPSRGDAEVEGHAQDDFFDFKGASSFHLQFLGSIHVKVGGLEPDFISYFPWGEFRGYLFLHFLLGYLVGSLGIVASSGQVRELTFQI